MSFNLFKNLRLGAKLACLFAVFLGGLVTFGVYAYRTMDTAKVNGPIYRQIVQGKDIIADILPPPEYIIESYLNALQMVDAVEAGADPAAVAAMVDRARLLREDYEARHAFWVQSLAEGELKRTLVQASYDPAMEFYTVRDAEFIPAILAGDLAEAQRLARTELTPKYEAHRSAIDAVVVMANERNRQDEASAAQFVSRAMAILVGLGVATALIAALVAFLIARPIARSAQQMVTAAEQIAQADLAALAEAVAALASGDLTVSLSTRTSELDLGSRDEMGDLARAFNQMIARLRETAQAFSTMTAKLNAVVGQVAQNASEIRSASDQLASSAGQSG